jgi:hypothetical protein
MKRFLNHEDAYKILILIKNRDILIHEKTQINIIRGRKPISRSFRK